MAIEKSWEAVPAQLFTSNGSSEGLITIASTKGFKVKQTVFVQATGQTDLQLQVKRVLSKTQLIVGPISGNLKTKTNLTLYTTAASASIHAKEQPRNDIPEKEYNRAVYAEEPTVAKRVIQVDELGEPFSDENPQSAMVEFIRNGVPQKVTEDTVDPSNNVPFPVKLTGIQGDVIIEAENLNLEVQSEGEYNVTTNPKPDSIGLVSHERGISQDRTKQTRRITAKRGTENTDTVSQDISLHDHLGNEYNTLNPLPISGSFEKFFTLIAASKWMELANYDEVIPTYSLGNTVLTLAYKQDGVTIGEAIITAPSLTSWSLKLNRFLNDDDGSQLLDDDNTPLNLD